ncbi:MAG: serine hydrolase [Planctomycetota bacterium]
MLAACSSSVTARSTTIRARSFVLAALTVGILAASDRSVIAQDQDSPAAGLESPFPSLEVQLERVADLDASLRGLSVAPDGAVWISGSSGTMGRRDPSTGEWRVWQAFEHPDADFRDVEAVSVDEALLMRIRGPAAVMRAKVSDVRLSVVSLLEEPRPLAFFDSIAFTDEGRGIVFGDPLDGELFVARTEAWGGAWERLRQPTLPLAGAGEAGFAASGTCIALTSESRLRIATGGATSRVFGSDDFGQTWFVVEHPIAGVSATSGAYSIAFADADHGVIVGGDFTKPDASELSACFTTDGGRTWNMPRAVRSSTQVGPSGYRSAVAAFPPLGERAFLAAGPNGLDWTLDGGETWARLPEAPGAHTLAYDATTNRMWFAGSAGRVGYIAVPDEELNELCEALRVENRLPALAVGVIEVGRPSRSLVVGDRDYCREDAPPLEQQLFMAGSITKVFTGTLLSLAVSAGLVELDQAIGEYLPDDREWPAETRAITFAQLASHSSGLPRMPRLDARGSPAGLPGDEMDPYGSASFDGLFEGLALSPPTGTPGDYSGYSNLGVALLGQAIAKAAGADYDALVRERILDPLGMTQSSVDSRAALDAAVRDGRLAVGFTGGDLAARDEVWHLGAYGPAGSLYGSVDDLLRFAGDHLRAARGENTILDVDALRRSHESRVEFGPGQSVGLGWHRADFSPDHYRLWHNGAVGGFQSLMVIDPSAGWAVILLCNRGPIAGPSPLDRVMPELLEFLAERSQRPR